jgi:hypothetical protein
MTILYVGSDTLLTVDGLKDQATGQYVNAASVSATVRDVDLQAVEGGTGLTLEYVANSNGKYQGVIPYTLTLTPGATYYLDITITDQQRRLDRIRCQAQYASGH